MYVRPIIKMLLLLVTLLAIQVPIALLCILKLESARQRAVLVVFKILARILGLRVHVQGAPSDRRPLMIVANHSSYADIFSLGAATPISFTPKSDIKFWPLVGWCCWLSACVFIERKPSKLPLIREHIKQGLKLGRPIALFAEGTTNNGRELKPFKSGFFSLAENEEGLLIQPATIVYTHRNGVALKPEQRSDVAWYGDALLIPHLFNFLSWRTIDVTIHFHEPVTMMQYKNRKALCQHCEQTIQACLNDYH